MVFTSDGTHNSLLPPCVLQMKTLQLRMELRRRGQPCNGTQDELAKRLATAITSEGDMVSLHSLATTPKAEEPQVATPKASAASEAGDEVDPSTVEINGTKISDVRTVLYCFAPLLSSASSEMHLDCDVTICHKTGRAAKKGTRTHTRGVVLI